MRTLPRLWIILFVLLIFFSGLFALFEIQGNSDRVGVESCNLTVGTAENGSELRVIGVFSTRYVSSSAGRSHNIQLAARAIDGTKVATGEIFSFNETVGERTVQRGYREATVIIGGEYTKDIGGGVCQVSSTLYNAWLLSGLGVKKCYAHSIPSNYVDYSRDATVSTLLDLQLINTSAFEIYIAATAESGNLSVIIYGVPSPSSYRIISTLLEEVKPTSIDFVDVVCADVQCVSYEILKEGRLGYKSQAVLEEYRDGALVKSEIIRRDFYKPRAPKILRKLPKTLTSAVLS